MAERPLYTLYKNLKAQNYDVPDDYNKFESALTRDGKGGADNRHAIYENLKAQNFDVPSTYERFYSALFEPRSKTSSRAKGGSVPMSAADRARFSAGAAAISASAQQTMNNAGRYKRLKQRKQKQQKDFGRVNLGTNKTPYGGDANNVVKDDFAYNPETGKTGAYVTSDNENVYSLPEAEQMQAILDKQNDAYQVAVDTGEIPSAFDVRDKNGNYDLQENIGKNGTYLTEEGAQKQFDKKLADAYARKKEIEALIAEDNRQHGNPLLSYGASIGAGNGRTAEQSDYRNKLATSLSLVTEQIGALEAVKQYPTSSWGEDALKALDNTAFTAKTWDFGLTDFAIMGQMERIKTKMDNNIPLSGSDKMLLKSKLGADAATALEDEKMGNVYRWTKIAGQSLPFMADFFLTGGYGGITKGISRGALKIAAKRGMGKVSAAILKNTGIVAGDVIGSYAMAGTEQALKTGADIMQRHLGNLYQDEKGDYKFGTFDENGNLLHEGGESIGTALYKGMTSAMVENYTEKLFGHNYGIKKGAVNFMEKHGMNASAEFFKNIGKSGWYTNSKKWMEKFGINGFAEEVMEEEIGIPLHALLDGEGKVSDLLDAKQQLDIIGGMAISVGSMYAMGAGSRPVKGIYNRAQYYRFRNKVNVADSDAQNLMGDNWADIKDKIDNATNEQMGSVLAGILRQRDTMSKEQINAAVNYGVNLMKMRGYNIAKTAEMNAKEITNEPTTPEEQHQSDIDNAYSEGHDADDADKHDIQIQQEDQMKTLAAALGISEQQLSAMSDEELESLTGQDDKLDQAIYDYQLSSARYQGVVDDAQDKVDLAAHQAEQRVDMYTDQSRGSVRNATIKALGGLEDYGVYIISGNIATHDDGSIDVSNSDDMILYYDPTTNSVEHADALMFAELGEELPADDVKAQAVADAKENAIKEVAGIIDGTVEVGSQFNVTDTDGTEHTYEVLADYGDGTAAISIDGNVVENPYSLADLQQMKDLEDQKRLEAAKAQREQMEKERAAQQNEETEETQPSFDFNQILNDNGNVVLVDVLDKDGNTKYPDSRLFLIRDAGAKAKVVELKSDGTLVPHAVNKEDVATISSMSLDEYKQAMPESSMIEDSSGENIGEIEVETPTIEGETAAPSEETAAPESAETPATEQTPAAPAITLEDGTIVPMLEDGNPDFSKLTAAQTAELYDSQFGEDADSIVSGYVSDAKKALDKASNMTVKGKTFVEQKAAKDAKEKAIADAQAAYDSAIAIRDAYNERQLAKVEDTAEGRKELIEKARRKFARLKSAVKYDAEAVSQLYRDTIGSLLHRLYDGTGIDVTDTIPLTAEEYVASNLGAHSLNYEGTETSKGVKQETGLSREDFAKTQLLAADGKGTTIDALVHSLWENRPSNLESLDTQDIRNALIGVLNSGFKASEARNFVENIRIAQAENILEEQKRAQENAAYAEQQKAEQEAELEAKSDEKAELKAKSEAKLDNESSNESNDLSNETDNEKINDNINDNINVPEDATDEAHLGAQRDESDLPFSAKENGKQQTTAERAADVEKNKVDDMKVVDNIVGQKTRKAFERLAKMMGANIQWQYSDKLGNGWIQETKDADGNVHRTIFITLDSSITEGAQFIFGHEMTHQINKLNPAAYNELTQLVLDTYGSDVFDKAVDETMQRYSDAGFSGRARDYYAEEVVADAVGEMIRDLNLAHTLAMKMSHPLLAAIHEILQKIKLAFFGTEYSDVTKNIIRSIEQAYVKTSNGQVTNSETGEDVSFSLRQKPEPKKKGIGYKVFVLKDGKLYPPMVANPDGAATPVGVWLDADAAPIAGESKTGRPQVKQGGKGTQGGSGKLAYRPGWHLGVVPYAIQFNRKDDEGNKTLFPKNFVFAEVEYAADVDYQEEARQEGINPSGKYQHSLAGLKHLPTDGYYMYRTNPNPETDPWVITGAMKVNRILTRAEQAYLVSKAGREPQQIQEGDIVTDDVVNSINQEIADAPKFSLKVYHGSGADFTEFDFDHMGEGAGSQVFGWGGYVTSSEKIGKSYAGLTIKNIFPSEYDTAQKQYTLSHVETFILEGSDKNEAIQKVKGLYNESLDKIEHEHPENNYAISNLKERIETLDEMEKGKLPIPTMSLYEVDIPDDNGSNYLEWEKTLTEKQINAIRDALAKNGVDISSFEKRGFKLDLPFKYVYTTVLPTMMHSKPKDVSKFLSSLGFTGIKYPAGTIMGGAEENDTNYVIFKPEDMKITEHTKFSLKTYHGTGANFDRFDTSHAYEGAGSETFGHGIYVTKSAKIGASYALKAKVKKIKTPKAFKAIKNGDNWFGRFIDNAVRSSFAKAKKETFNRMDELIKEDENIVNDETKPEWKQNAAQKELADFDKLKSLFEGLTEEDIPSLKRAKANRYEVEIPDDTGNNYLDWNKPMKKEQKKIVREGLEKLGVDVDRLVRNGYSLDKNFGDVYNGLLYYALNGTKFEERDSFVASSNFLSSLGFTGIKYYAGTIWGGAKKGDLNYVIFNEDDAKIVGNTKFSLKSKPVRFEAGKKLSDEEKKEVLSTLKDAYKVNGVPYHIEETAGGKEKRVYEPTAYSYVVSDITNRPLRYYITLPDGRVAHPTEVYPNISDNEVKSSATKQGLLDDEADQIVSAAIGNMKDIADNAKAVEVLTELQNLPHETHDVGYGLNNAQSYNYKTGIFTSDAGQAIDYVVRRMRRKEDVPTDVVDVVKTAVNESYGMVDSLLDALAEKDAPKTFEEFLNHPSLKFSIKNEEQRNAAEDAYEYASKLRPNKSSQYALVDMSNPSSSPEYYEKKVLADRWRRFYNKAVHNELDYVYKDAWGNYKLFDLDRPFADQVNEVKGDVPNEFNAPDVVANKNADNESGAEYHEYKQDEQSSITYKDRYKAFKQRVANREKTAGLRKERKEVEDSYNSKSKQRLAYNKQLMKEYMDKHGLSSENDIPYDVWEDLRSKSFEKYQDELDSLFNKYKDLDKQIKAVAEPRFSLKDEKTLAGVHNISEEKLLKAIKQGGLANPSVAVIDSSKQKHEGYGDISLILPSDKVAKRTGKNAGTWQGDAYTPTYPQVERHISDKGSEQVNKDVLSVPKEMQHEVRNGIYRWLDGDANSGLKYLFLHENGNAPKMAELQHKYSDKVYNDLKSITSGNFDISSIGKADAQKVLDMYIDNVFGGDRDAYDEKQKYRITRYKKQVADGEKNPFLLSRAKNALEQYDKYGFYFDKVQDFVRNVERDHSMTGVDTNATLNEVEDYIKTNNLTDEFNTWLEGKEKEYGIKEVIFDGFTPSGNRRYVPNTLENVSKIMKKQGRNGATSAAVSFQNFAARLMPSYGTLKDIRSKKDLLTSDRKKFDDFREKWSNVFFELGMKCQPDATGTFDDYGLARLSEAAMTSDPQAYLKKEYNVDFSDEDTKRLKEMVKAIKEESPAMYFETKFERPVRFDEFSAAVVPTTTKKEVKEALKNAGVSIFEYDEKSDADRKRALNEAINSSDNIRFSLKEEKEKIIADSKANGTYMTAPNGEKTKLDAEQWATVRTTNFKNWFGDWENDHDNASKVVDENGEPMVVWHGRSAEFNTFEKKEGVRFIMGIEDKVKAEGFFFSPDKGLAEEFASNSSRHRGGKANVVPCFLNIRRPMDLTGEDYDRIYEDVTGWEYMVGMDTQDNLWGIMDEEGMAEKIKEKGYDGAIFVEEVDDSYEPTKISYCALDANQIKSAENNNGDFSADNNDIRFSLAGERGAAAADKAEERTFRMDNLSVAKDMEKNKKKPKAIKAATGWERGADGKWRYEMPDVVLRDPKEWVNKKTLTLSDIVEKPNDLFKEYPELFDAYPELKDMKILNGRAKSGGVFYNNAITLNLGDIREAIKYDLDTHYKLANNSLKKTLVHEIQHYIQEQEGFAQGGNSEMIVDKNALDAIAKLRAEKDEVAKEFYAMSPAEQQKRKYEINNRYNDLTKQIERLEKSSRIGYDGYNRLSGEVEARNVSARLYMTPEERRKTLAESTEDVARKDQILLGVGDVSFSLRDMADGKESGAADMAEDLKSLNTPDEVDDAIKTAIEDMPSGWQMANKKMIHIAQALGENRKAEIAGEEPKFSLKDGSLIKAGTYFSGGGLVEEGLKGIIDPVVAVEYDEKISGVYRNNFGQHIVTADVRDVDPRELVKQIDGEVEYFHASPVCKNYSQAKSNHAEVELDKETAASTAEFINAIKPKVVTIENVKGYKDSDAMKIITDALDANGYTWDADVYNAADYGGYTNRERLIVRAVRDGKLPEKPKKMSHKSGWYEAVADIIPTLTEKKNGVAPWMDIRLKADGIDWRNIDKPLYVMGSAYADGKIPHAFADELLPTLRTKSGDVIVMPDGKVYRAMGRVLARVSGVSDDYKMPFSENLSHTIIGNGIPTQLTEHVIAPLLQNTLRPTTPEDGNTKFSLRYDKFEHDLNQWKKDNNLPKDAQRPTIPQRNAGESAVDFLRRVDEYRKQMALWKTAPTYEQHLLSDDTALGEFNRELQRGSVLKRIAFQDSMLAIRKAQEAIMKEVGVDRLNMAEDAYTAENRSHGKGKNEFEEYNNEFLQPLRKAYHQMKKILGDSYDNVRIYMMAKHGLERDAQMAFKKSLEADFEDVAQRSAAYKAYKGDMNRITNDSDLEFGRVDFNTWRQRDNALRTKYSHSYMDYRYDENGISYDYSGLSALFGGYDFEESAHKLVRDIESSHVAEVQDLWNATNAATKKILRDGYKAGMMSKDTYQYVRDMYSHYIPLRGWDGTTADQVWDYIGGGKGAFNQTLKTAHGRTTIADDPIAYIENMAESGILLNNKNWVKQHLMLLAQNHPTSLLTLSKAWYVKSTDANGNEEWIPATPQITSQMNSNQVKAAIDAFEKKMEQMAQTGDATQQRDGLNIAYPQTHSEEREHEVRVMKDGEEYVIYVNGDPQLAQAMNNTRAHRVREIQSGKLDRAAAWLGRKMAAAYTSLSPLFIPSNYFRDLTMTLASTAIREDAKYNYLLRKNLTTSWNLGFMLRDFQNGKLRDKVNNGNATPKEHMFYDFMMNGGETGFVSSLDVEDLKKKFKNDLKDLDKWKANPVKVGHTIMDSIEFLNRAIEDSNRFAVYMTSIQYGRSIDEAVNDAKDVTLNFNRKGTGEYGWQMIRNLYLFINPAVQSLQTLGALAKHHPFKFTAVTASWLASGVLVPVVNAALMSLLGGDDDKDKYWQFSKWDRRNNLIMWIPYTHEYVKIPLAQEFRAFYGVGDMIASKMMGGELAEESWEEYAEDLMGQVVDMLPLDPTGYDGNIAVSLMPNAIRPVFELAFNVDFTGKPLFKETEYNKYDPNFTKAYVGTPDWLVRISRMVNSIGNDYPDVQQNSIDAFGDPRYNLNNPAVVDHVLSSYLGGAYTMGSQVLGLLTKSLNDPKEIKVADIPLFSKFVSNPDDRPVTKKQGDEFWNMKENHDRAANTLSKLKKQAKVDGDYSMLERFYVSEEYKQYKQDDVKVKKYEEDKKKERADESGEEYRPHKLNAEDIYKAHATPKDDFEDLKLKQLYTKLNGFKSAYDLLVDTAPSQSDSYYNTNKAGIDAIDEISLDKQEISELKKGFLDDGKDAYNAEDMKQIRELRKKILSVLEKANKVVVANQKAKAEK
jgi:site-specific DNA-cytosine methylase|nr:MAG TPA: cytosine DNA methyltransferase [Caudoviricetes sp.]